MLQVFIFPWWQLATHLGVNYLWAPFEWLAAN